MSLPPRCAGACGVGVSSACPLVAARGGTGGGAAEAEAAAPEAADFGFDGLLSRLGVFEDLSPRDFFGVLPVLVRERLFAGVPGAREPLELVVPPVVALAPASTAAPVRDTARPVVTSFCVGTGATSFGDGTGINKARVPSGSVPAFASGCIDGACRPESAGCRGCGGGVGFSGKNVGEAVGTAAAAAAAAKAPPPPEGVVTLWVPRRPLGKGGDRADSGDEGGEMSTAADSR